MKNLSIVKKIMNDFTDRTCLIADDCKPVRYLWTDAFALCNFLELFNKTSEQKYKDSALRLVEQVHLVLGKHRDDDPRSGWISGLDEDEGKKHPTIGGLRIGKKLNERKKDEPYDDRLEWDRDGQYFHYLTKWMHALNRLTEVSNDFRYNRWAVELAKTAHNKFTYTVPGTDEKRMYWKMSIDLSYALVPSMGAHDALDGYITYLQLESTASKDLETADKLYLDQELKEIYRIYQNIDISTDDPLGIGGLLSDACKLAQLITTDNISYLDDMLLRLLQVSKEGLEVFMLTDTLRYPPQYRLAFRELGLAIGLKAVKKIELLIQENKEQFKNMEDLQSQLTSIREYLHLSEAIEEFWLNPENQKSSSWVEYIDINSVMLAATLMPDAYLTGGRSNS
jgi:hypothetical protein